ncbi:MAG: Crp/Fnr family transcriptional regulator [bacterium]
MDQNKAMGCLKSLAIFRAFPEDKLKELAEVLSPVSHTKNGIIFDEGSRGNSLFLVTAGEVRIEKKLDPEGKTFKQLAIFAEGDFFGEMALVEDQVRFARAFAQTDVSLLELEKSKLFGWIEKQPVAAVSFFVEMVRTISLRLRRTSSELTMLFDLSRLAMEHHASGEAFLARLLDEVMPHLEGAWKVGAYFYNQFNGEYVLTASVGPGASALPAPEMLPQDSRSAWLNDSVYRMVLPGKDCPRGYVIFSGPGRLDAGERNNMTVAFTTLACLTVSVLENIEHQTETTLMERLKEQKLRSA